MNRTVFAVLAGLAAFVIVPLLRACDPAARNLDTGRFARGS